MPSIKNSCNGCALLDITEQLTVYSVEDVDRQNHDVQASIRHHAGLEDGKKPKSEIINSAARRCIEAICSGECSMYTLTDRGFLFRN